MNSDTDVKQRYELSFVDGRNHSVKIICLNQANIEIL